MKATRHQVDKLTERCLDLAARYRDVKGVTYDGLLYNWEHQTGVPLKDYRQMDALVFAYHLGYFTRHWGMKP